MRYLKWISVLLILILVVLEVIYNFSAMSQSFKLVFRLPGKTFFTIEMQIWFGLLLMFILGFGLAIILEIYFWYKYTMTIRKQNKIIQNLEQKLKALEEKTISPELEATQPASLTQPENPPT